jgi:hypothetical protein
MEVERKILYKCGHGGTTPKILATFEAETGGAPIQGHPGQTK